MRSKSIQAICFFSVMCMPLLAASAPLEKAGFRWPEGKTAAISLSFDDARPSQVQTGLPLFERYGLKVTFYVVPDRVEEHLDAWKRAVAQGHEIGNHTIHHPGTGNFAWARKNPIESYTLDRMQSELEEANLRIARLLGVTPRSFAYTCGHTSVGRGASTVSYVPLVSRMFLSGRCWKSEVDNDPEFGDLSQIMAIEMDGKSFQEIKPLVDDALAKGRWLVLAGHDIAWAAAPETTQMEMLCQLLEYLHGPASRAWAAPVGVVAKHIAGERSMLSAPLGADTRQ